MDEYLQDAMGVEVHTLDNPYCDDPGCWCHTDVDYHEWVQHPGYSDEDVEQAYSFYGVDR